MFENSIGRFESQSCRTDRLVPQPYSVFTKDIKEHVSLIEEAGIKFSFFEGIRMPSFNDFPMHVCHFSDTIGFAIQAINGKGCRNVMLIRNTDRSFPNTMSSESIMNVKVLGNQFCVRTFETKPLPTLSPFIFADKSTAQTIIPPKQAFKRTQSEKTPVKHDFLCIGTARIDTTFGFGHQLQIDHFGSMNRKTRFGKQHEFPENDIRFVKGKKKRLIAFV